MNEKQAVKSQPVFYKEKVSLHQFDNHHFGSVAAAGAQLIDAGIAAGAALFRVAGAVLGAVFTEQLFHHGMLVVLGAFLVFLLALVVVLGFLMSYR